MDTVYYTVNFRRVKVAGGQDRTVLALIPSAQPEKRGRGEVVDLELGRRHLETKAAWKALVNATMG